MFVSGRDSVVSQWILYGWVILRSTKQKHVGIWTTTIPASNFTKYLFWSWPWELCPGALVVNEMNISDESFNCLHNAKFTFLKKSRLHVSCVLLPQGVTRVQRTCGRICKEEICPSLHLRIGIPMTIALPQIRKPLSCRSCCQSRDGPTRDFWSGDSPIFSWSSLSSCVQLFFKLFPQIYEV